MDEILEVSENFVYFGKRYEGDLDHVYQNYLTDKQFYAEPITFQEWLEENGIIIN